MAGVEPPFMLRVFLASPGDVRAERTFVRTYLESALPKSPLLHGRSVKFDVIAWDDPHAPTPMPAHLTPQEAVIAAKGCPADCDIVIVIFASRLGTHLALDKFARLDGSAYRSGTEWEYEDAWNAKPRPEIRVYRRDDLPPILASDPERRKKLDQLDLVDSFLERFIHPDGSACGGYQTYRGLDDFKTKLAHDLQSILAARIGPAPVAGTPADPLPGPPAVPPPERCVGRGADSAKVVAALTADGAPTAVLVQGPGGIGKTTLTQDAANHAEVLARFGPRRWLVALDTATDRDTFDAALLTAIGLDPAAGFAPARQRLAQAPTLLVLDNLETPWEHAGPAIEARLGELAGIRGVTLLASFRGQAVVGGVRWSLRQRVDPLPDDEARALFLGIADTIPVGDWHLPDLLAALGGVPLAICLTARRAAGRTELAGLWAEWQRIGPEIAAWQGAEPGRLTSVPHSIALSLLSARVSPAGHRLFALLGQSPAGLATEDRTALLGDAAFAAEEGLLAVGLAYHRDGRLDLLPPVRDHARLRCPPQAADAFAWCRHFLILAREQGRRVLHDGGAQALIRLVPEVANFDGALRAAAALSLRETAVAAGEGIHRVLRASGAGSIAALRALAEDCRAAHDTGGEAACCFHAGVVALDRWDHDLARALCEQARPLYRQAGNSQGEANCIKSLGDISLARSDHAAARALYEQARSAYQQIGDVLGEANCIHRLGDIALMRSDPAKAQALYKRARPLYRQVDDVLGEANCLQRLGDIALRHRDYVGAQALYEQAHRLFQRFGAVLGEANCIRSMGDIALTRADYAKARVLYEQARELLQQIGDMLDEAACIACLGRVAQAQGEVTAALTFFAQALATFEQLHATQNLALAHEDLARVTTGSERAGHVAAARAAWASMDLPEQVARVDRAFG